MAKDIQKIKTDLRKSIDLLTKVCAQIKEGGEKLADPILTSADLFKEVIGESYSFSPKVSQAVNGLSNKINDLTKATFSIIDVIEKQLPAVQSALEEATKAKEAIDLIPTGETDPVKLTIKDGSAGPVDLRPNTAAGPQSALQASIGQQEYRDSIYQGRGLNWAQLNESQLFEDARRGDDEFGLAEWTTKQQPLDKFSYRQKVQEAMDRDDLEDLGTQLQESMDGKGHFNWRAMNSQIGSMSNMGINLDTIKGLGKGNEMACVNQVG